ncbi:MAG: AraC family transcriptional regulator [Clostridia bacterium]|nr:AraC family transcriptional regulator [Clostridia bacterium]
MACESHLHYHLEFFYLLEGQSRVYVDSAVYDVFPGDLLLVFPNQIHRFECVSPERYLLFIINPDMMPELEGAFLHRTPTQAIIRNVKDDPYLLSLMHLLAESAMQASPYSAATMRGTMLAFFGRLLSRVELTRGISPNLHSVRTIVDYCTRNYASPTLSLKTMEEELHLSRYHISHIFSHKLNINFNRYINSLRISSACRLLRSTDRSITEIAGLSGFNTSRSFNRAFFDQMGLSPTQYRRAMASIDAVNQP